MIDVDLAVAPYVGAWIETEIAQVYGKDSDKSHPMWVRGLKQLTKSGTTSSQVAPYVGAWIETKEFADVAQEISRTLCGCVD